MVRHDDEKEWMRPLLYFRDKLKNADRSTRDFRRMSGNVQLFHGEPIPGPYVQKAREDWLRELLEVQTWVQQHGPEHVRDLELISLDELNEIRRLWVTEKHELEDSLPRIYETAVGKPYPGKLKRDHSAFGASEIQILREVAGDSLHFEMVRELLATAQGYSTMARRAGLLERLEKAIRKSFYTDEADAKARAEKRQQLRESLSGQLTLEDDLEEGSLAKQQPLALEVEAK